MSPWTAHCGRGRGGDSLQSGVSACGACCRPAADLQRHSEDATPSCCFCAEQTNPTHCQRDRRATNTHDRPLTDKPPTSLNMFLYLVVIYKHVERRQRFISVCLSLFSGISAIGYPPESASSSKWHAWFASRCPGRRLSTWPTTAVSCPTALGALCAQLTFRIK